ncbi:tRNA wybutosine-synthesizing protein 3 homolog isoform X1 [Cervus canadensis]|uniref:tRNA wybutosine-synthesizing protein 3 homolog isoform X1 n=1 Tax=Cervus canadensis TaxID=1574408 RepID=UPI0018B89280|nr:tRNA wybutosine-synthesizing protein 3 homolog isoform X1 [Cervus canadensis]
MDLSAEFKRWKAQCLSKVDLSRKGSVDEDVLEIVQLLNGQEQFFTTSSCAGRIILLDGSINGSEVQKQNCSWLLVTHKACVKDDVVVALRRANGDAILKFEPLVLHVQCRQLQDARILHSVAIDSGFRNSGITVGKRGKIMLAVRSTHGLEVPLSHQGKLMVTEEYIAFLLKIANQKMEENKKRIERSEKYRLFIAHGPLTDLKNRNSFSQSWSEKFCHEDNYIQVALCHDNLDYRGRKVEDNLLFFGGGAEKQLPEHIFLFILPALFVAFES